MIHVHGRIFKHSDITLRHTIEGLPAPTLDKHKPIAYPGEPKRDWEEQLRDGNEKVYDHVIPN